MHNNLNWEKSGLTWYLCCGSSRALLNKALLHFLCLPVCFVCWLVLKVVRKEALNTIRWAQVPKWIEISWYVCSRHIPILLCIFLIWSGLFLSFLVLLSRFIQAVRFSTHMKTTSDYRGEQHFFTVQST